MNWIRDHQPDIRADLYKGIVDSITVGRHERALLELGLFSRGHSMGGFRDMKRRHMDAMELV